MGTRGYVYEGTNFRRLAKEGWIEDSRSTVHCTVLYIKICKHYNWLYCIHKAPQQLKIDLLHNFGKFPRKQTCDFAIAGPQVSMKERSKC